MIVTHLPKLPVVLTFLIEITVTVFFEKFSRGTGDQLKISPFDSRFSQYLIPIFQEILKIFKVTSSETVARR